MKTSTKLINLCETYRGIDCEALARLCTKEADTVLFSTCGHAYQFTFDDCSSITFFKATITERIGDRVIFEKTDLNFLNNFQLPFDGDYDEYGKLVTGRSC